MEKKEDITNKSERINIQTSILNISASMLGVAFIVISFLHATEKKENTFLDEIIFISAIAFMINCILAFLALRHSKFQTKLFVNITSVLYIIGMFMLFGIALMMVLGLIK